MSDDRNFDRVLDALHEDAPHCDRWPDAAGLIDEPPGTHRNSMNFGNGEAPENVPGGCRGPVTACPTRAGRSSCLPLIAYQAHPEPAGGPEAPAFGNCGHPCPHPRWRAVHARGLEARAQEVPSEHQLRK